MENETNGGGAQVPCISLLAAIQKELCESFALAEGQLASEKLGGNIVKENYWHGELAALHRLRRVIEANVKVWAER